MDLKNDETLQAIVEEAVIANAKYGSPKSTQESLGVLLEEFDELKAAIHANHASNIAYEAIQVAAVAYRLAKAVDDAEPDFFSRSGFQTKTTGKEL